MVRPNPVKVIDSMDDLYLENNIEIIATESTSIQTFTSISDLKRAENFGKRLKLITVQTLNKRGQGGAVVSVLKFGVEVPGSSPG